MTRIARPEAQGGNPANLVHMPSNGSAVPSYALAASAVDRERAFRLVYDSYLRSGLCSPNGHQLRVTPYHLLPTTSVFIAKIRGEVISTMSLVRDGELGLPMESMYPAEIRDRRESGVAMAEVSCLADRRKDPRRFMEVFANLARVMAQFGRRHGVRQLLIVCHPRHARFYSRYLGFQPIGELKSCPHVQGNPAIPMFVDFDEEERKQSRAYRQMFGELLPELSLKHGLMDPPEMASLRQIVDECYEVIPQDNFGNEGDRIATC